MLQIEISWNCDLDYSIDKCLPIYSFNRYDLPFTSSSTASGFNFRYSEKFEIDGVKYRNLIKAYGLRIFIVVNGKAGKFDFIPLFLTIGSGIFSFYLLISINTVTVKYFKGIGLLALPNIISDFILLNFTAQRKFYKDLKEYDYKKNLESIKSHKKIISLDEQLTITEKRYCF